MAKRKRHQKRGAPARLPDRQHLKRRYIDAEESEEDSFVRAKTTREMERLREENQTLRSQLAAVTKRVTQLLDQSKDDRERIGIQKRKMQIQDKKVAEVIATITEAFQGYQDTMQRHRSETPASPTNSSSGSEEIQVYSAFSDSESDYSTN
ncbi:hypothetical protein CBS470a_005431 [Colletotrichum nupharicola]|nr:hypothetical protein CBS470a_005431 [Colletotrichum nupharicola]